MESRSAWLQSGLSATLLALALLMGGGQGWLGDVVCQLLAIALIAISVWRHEAEPVARWPRYAWLAALPLLIPVLQLLPLPDALWSLPPERDLLAQDMATVGVDVPSRWSLSPLSTERALWWMLPAVAMYLAVLQQDARRRHWLLVLVLVIALASVLLGLAQLAGGPASPLRFYRVTNESQAVGFFANRNHYASLLALALPLVTVGIAVWNRRQSGAGSKTFLGLLAGTGLIALLILGLAMSRSRGGLVVGMVGVLASLPIALKLRDQHGGLRRLLAAAIAVGLALVVNFALVGILQRVDRDPLKDSRVQFASVSLMVAAANAPLGTGLGGFEAAYEAGVPLPDGPDYVNHAHNDYVELWLETGWLVVPVALVFAGAFVVAGAKVWRRLKGDHGEGRDAAAMRAAAWVALLLLALHSIVDYPLRTTALLAVAGLLAAAVAPVSPKRSTA